MSQGGCVSIAYTARHPDRVRKLIVYGGYLQGGLSENPTPEALEVAEMHLKLLKLSWGNESPAYRQVFTTLLIPEGTPSSLLGSIIYSWSPRRQRTPWNYSGHSTLWMYAS